MSECDRITSSVRLKCELEKFCNLLYTLFPHHINYLPFYMTNKTSLLKQRQDLPTLPTDGVHIDCLISMNVTQLLPQ